MKKISFLHRGWLCLCLGFLFFLFGCGIGRQVGKSSSSLEFLELHAVSPHRLDVGTLDYDYSYSQPNTDNQLWHYVFRFPVEKRWLAFQVRNELIAQGADIRLLKSR